jgi:hypothetical protein
MLQAQSAVQSSEILQSPGVIQSLEGVRARVVEQLTNVPEFRALLAVETAIEEVANIPDLMACLESAKTKIIDRLTKVREYQALLAVEKSITEISEVLGVLAGGEFPHATSPAVAPEAQEALQLEADEPTPPVATEVATAPQPSEPVASPTAPLQVSARTSKIEDVADNLATVLGLSKQ